MKRFWILMLLALVPACSGGMGSGGDTPVDIPEDQAMPISRHAQNYLLKGETIHTDVIASYQPVLDFYGEDSQSFKDLVAANLSTVETTALCTESGIPLSYFDILDQFPDATLVVELKDGTTQNFDIPELKLDKNKLLTTFKNIQSKANTLKVCGKMPSHEKLNEALDNIANSAPTGINGLVLTVTDNLKNIFDKPSYQNLLSIATSISKACSFISAGIDIAGALGIFGGPGKDATQVKLDYIIDMLLIIDKKLDAIRESLVDIENQINQVQATEFQFKLSSTINQINSFVQELSCSTTPESKKIVSDEFRIYINGLMANYIDYALEVTTQQKKLTCFTDKNKTAYTDDYKDIVLSFNMPYSDDFDYYHRDWKWANGGTYYPEYSTVHNPVQYDYKLAQVKLSNPNFYLPVNYSHLVYLQNLIITRMNMNSLVEDSTTLDQYNSNVAKTYLDRNVTNPSYVGKLKKSLLASYTQLKTDLDEALLVLENSKKNQKLMSDNLVKPNWLFSATKTGMTQNQGGYYSTYQVPNTYYSKTITPVKYNTAQGDDFTPAPFKAVYLVNTPKSVTININGTTSISNPYLLMSDFSWNESSNPPQPLPVMNSDPYTMYNSYFPIIQNGFNDVVYKYGQTLNSPKIQITPIDANYVTLDNRAFGDAAALDDAKALLIKTYRAKTQKLLELAATLAALEIYLNGYVIE